MIIMQKQHVFISHGFEILNFELWKLYIFMTKRFVEYIGFTPQCEILRKNLIFLLIFANDPVSCACCQECILAVFSFLFVGVVRVISPRVGFPSAFLLTLTPCVRLCVCRISCTYLIAVKLCLHVVETIFFHIKTKKISEKFRFLIVRVPLTSLHMSIYKY